MLQVVGRALKKDVTSLLLATVPPLVVHPHPSASLAFPSFPLNKVAPSILPPSLPSFALPPSIVTLPPAPKPIIIPLDISLDSDALHFVDFLGKKVTEEQLEAIKSDPSLPLQILAGPGTGKTHVLALRIAHFVKDLSIEPGSICVLTFSRKAANQLKTRLKELLGAQDADRLQLGTFHSFCSHLLRQHGPQVGRSSAFVVRDPEESLRIINEIIQSQTTDETSQLYLPPLHRFQSLSEVEMVRDYISRAKRLGQTPKVMAAEATEKLRDGVEPVEELPLIEYSARVYEEYEAHLRRTDSMDLDDFVLKAVQLLDTMPRAAELVQHLFVDELQDTSVVQLQFLKHLFKNAKSFTAVGDPDQAIYSFQSAMSDNFTQASEMVSHRNPRTLSLSHNFRSTADIVEFGAAIIEQASSRIPRYIASTFPRAHPVIFREHVDVLAEVDFVTEEILELRRHEIRNKKILGWDSFAVLCRQASQLDLYEVALTRARIPYRVAGNRFFKKRVVRLVIAYLELVRDPASISAFQAILLVEYPYDAPPELPMLDYLSSKKTGVRISRKTGKGKAVTRMIDLVQRLQIALSKDQPLDVLLGMIEPSLSPESTQQTDRDLQQLLKISDHVARREVEISSPKDDNVSLPFSLDRFLAEISEVKASGGNIDHVDTTPKVTLSTVHAVKGLEFDVVFLPSVQAGTFPHTRATATEEEFEEERRLLYVAVTRAESLLYLSRPHYDYTRSGSVEIQPSPFFPDEDQVRTESRLERDDKRYMAPLAQLWEKLLVKETAGS